MPLIRKRKREEESEEQPHTKKKKTKRMFEVYSSVGYKEDYCHSLYSNIPYETQDMQELVSRELVSLLNTSGGILCFGARPTGTVYGVKISRQEEDSLKCAIDEVVKRIHPMVKPGMYRTTFTPVVDHREKNTQSYVLEIRVQKGDLFQLYETGGSDPNYKIGKKTESQVFVRNGPTVSHPLTPYQIKTTTCKLLKEKLNHQATLVERLKTTPAVSSAAPPNTGTTKVKPPKGDTALKDINNSKKSKNEGEKKASKEESDCDKKSVTKVTARVENDECPIPEVKPQPKKKTSKISSLVASIRKSVKQTFSTKSKQQVTAPSNRIPSAQPYQASQLKNSYKQEHLHPARPVPTSSAHYYPDHNRPPLMSLPLTQGQQYASSVSTYPPVPPYSDHHGSVPNSSDCMFSNRGHYVHHQGNAPPYSYHQRQYAKNHYDDFWSCGQY